MGFLGNEIPFQEEGQEVSEAENNFNVTETETYESSKPNIQLSFDHDFSSSLLQSVEVYKKKNKIKKPKKTGLYQKHQKEDSRKKARKNALQFFSSLISKYSN